MNTRSLDELQILVTDHSGIISDDRRPVWQANIRMLKMRNRPSLTFEEWQGVSASSAFTLLRKMGVEEDEPAVQAEYTEIYREVRATGTHPVCYGDAVIYFARRKAEGRSNIILSSHPLSELRRELEEYRLDRLFDDVIGDVADKGVALKKLLGFRAPRTMSYVGDMTHDVHAAQRAGITSIGVASGYHSRETLEAANPDVLVDSLTELNTLFCTRVGA